MRLKRGALVVAVAATLVLSACGDDDDEPTAAAGDSTEYCELSAALDEQDGPPTIEQLEELEAVAPEEIAEEVTFVVDRFREDGLDAFMDDEVGKRFEVMEPWEEENCPGAADDEAEDEEPAPQEPAEGATQVNVVATDYDFAIEGEVPAGKVAFVMQNDGEEDHHMSIIRFKDGTTMEQAEAAIEEGLDAIGQLMDSDVGESVDAAPGETAVINADLEPGLYGMACFVEGDDGPHFVHGMRIAFEVA